MFSLEILSSGNLVVPALSVEETFVLAVYWIIVMLGIMACI